MNARSRPTVYTRHVVRHVRQPSRANWIWAMVAIALFGTTLAVSIGLFFLLRSLTSAPSEPLPQSPPTQVALSAPDGPIQVVPTQPPVGGYGSVEGLTIQPWTRRERFTVLLVGLDRRPTEEGTAFRTDTLILVSINPPAHSVGILSIPRDLWVAIPGFGENRVNTAYALGEQMQIGGGPALAMETVQYNLGIRIHNYVVVGFEAFIALVDAIGGIDIQVPYPINDPWYPDFNFGYDPLYIPAGLIHMDGDLALKYARTRHTSDDFDRARRQQQIIRAIRERVLSTDALPGLIGQSPQLWAQFSNSIQTGLTLDQIISLVWYLKDFSENDLHFGVIDERYVTSVMIDDAYVLIPNRYLLGNLMAEVFGPDYSQ